MTTATEVKVLKAHLALHVHDVERSIEFYRKMLGIEPSKVRTGYEKFDVQNPPLNLTLNRHSFKRPGLRRAAPAAARPRRRRPARPPAVIRRQRSSTSPGEGGRR